MEQSSSISSQVQLLALPDCGKHLRMQTLLQLLLVPAQRQCRHSRHTMKQGLDTYLIPLNIGLSWEEPCLELSKGKVRVLISGSSELQGWGVHLH